MLHSVCFEDDLIMNFEILGIIIAFFLLIWTVLAVFLVRAVFRIVKWFENQKLSGFPHNISGYSYSTSEKPLDRADKDISEEDEQRLLQEKVALQTALNRKIDYEGVESNLDSLVDDKIEEDDSMDAVEKLRNLK